MNKLLNKYINYENKNTSHEEECQVIYVNTLPSKRWSITPHPLSVDSTH
jgi:hypothetical protein